VRIDSDFLQVMRACAAPRPGQDGTWISAAMIRAYSGLQRLGHAHSIECWFKGALAGGVYGVALGTVFFGESMFSARRDASKVALWHLCRLGYELIDCQIYSPHLESLGAREIPRDRFCALLQHGCRKTEPLQDYGRSCTG